MSHPNYQKKYLYSVSGIFGFLFIWQIVAIFAGQPAVLPGPIATIFAAAELLGQGYWRDLLATSGRALVGWTIALLVGIPVGLIFGAITVAYDFSRGVTSFLRSIPAFMLLMIPATMGTGGEIARIFTISFASCLIIIDECAESLSKLSQDRVELIKAYQGGFWFILSRVLFFEALGRTIVPVSRTTVSISFILAIICENLLPPSYGIGARLLTSLSGLEMSSVYAFLLLTGLAGVFLNASIHFVAKRTIFWT